jgi:glutamyl-tRNA synthetase
MSAKVRFAPSPTGQLHVGNARTALLNALFCRREHGTFILRFDDTDAERSRAEFARAIAADLTWMGITWQAEVRQSERIERYKAAFARLVQEGSVYPCYETQEELEFKRRRLLARRQPPLYDRAALSLTATERAALQAEGRVPYWRLKLPAAEIAWEDLVRGPSRIRADSMSDPILIRADGTFLYMLPSTVDDIELGITHVIRGEDHVPNTAVQIVLCRALGGTPPHYAHVPLLTDRAGQGLSKRLGSLTLQSLRAGGIEPMALNAFLATLGTGIALRPALSLDDLADDFELGRLAGAAAKFDDEQLRRFNERFVHELPYDQAAPKLNALGLERADEAFWLAVRDNLHQIGEAAYWHQVCFGDIEAHRDEEAFTAEAAALLPPEPWTAATWSDWITQLKSATGRRGRDLFQPLRCALTGRADGPELKALLPLIGRAKAQQRLQGTGP